MKTPPEAATATGHPSAVSPDWGGLHAAELRCETCGESTPHRVLRITARRHGADVDRVEGLARCNRCRWTHPFRIEVYHDLQLPVVLSDQQRSQRMVLSVPHGRRLQVGSGIPGVEPPLRILRIDRKDGTRRGEALSQDVATLWATPDRERPVPVSLTLGSKTAASRVALNPDAEVAVGDPITVAGASLRVFALRARGQTWTHVGDRIPARELQRIYTRRAEMPPAGRRRWSTSRERPSSRESSTSRSPRSRSSPGTRIQRRRPRARRALGGAAVQSDSRS